MKRHRNSALSVFVYFFCFMTQILSGQSISGNSLTSAKIFEKSIKARRANNIEMAIELAQQSLDMSFNKNSRAEIRLFLADLLFQQQRYSAARDHYYNLHNEGILWKASSLHGIAQTSAFLGEMEEFFDAWNTLNAKFPEHPLTMSIARIGAAIKTELSHSAAAPLSQTHDNTSEYPGDGKIIPTVSDQSEFSQDYKPTSQNTGAIKLPAKVATPAKNDSMSLELWRFTPQGKIKARDLMYDFNGQYDFSRQNVVSISLDYAVGNGLALTPSYWRMNAEGLTTTTLFFDGLLYGAGSKTRLELSFPELSMKKRFNSRGQWQFYGIAGATFPSLKFRLRQQLAAGIRECLISQEKVLPLAGFILHGPYKILNPFVEAKISTDGFSDKSSIFDYNLGLKIASRGIFSGKASLETEVGYRWLRMRVISGPDSIFKMRFHGMFMAMNMLF